MPECVVAGKLDLKERRTTFEDAFKIAASPEC